MKFNIFSIKFLILLIKLTIIKSPNLSIQQLNLQYH
jgi:hypothetical protein